MALKQTAIRPSSLYSTSQLIFLLKARCVFCEIQTEFCVYCILILVIEGLEKNSLLLIYQVCEFVEISFTS